MITATAMTHPGSIRERNEDTLVAPGLFSAGAMVAPATLHFPGSSIPLMFAVVDGMGGHRGGQTASRLVAQHLLDHPSTDVATLLDQANAALYRAMQGSPELVGMGATIAGVLVEGDSVTVFNVGDARVYHRAGDYLVLVTTDDRSDVASNVITQSLGGGNRLTAVTPHLRTLRLAHGHRLLVCSDGVSDVVPFDGIDDCMGDPNPTAVAQHILAAAIGAGAPDNVSILILDHTQPGLSE
jgi:serine/threonine protein phosphatase PrpC